MTSFIRTPQVSFGGYSIAFLGSCDRKTLQNGEYREVYMVNIRHRLKILAQSFSACLELFSSEVLSR